MKRAKPNTGKGSNSTKIKRSSNRCNHLWYKVAEASISIQWKCGLCGQTKTTSK